MVSAGEAQLVMQLLSGLLAVGVPSQDVGIISPYKAQVGRLAFQTAVATKSSRLVGMHCILLCFALQAEAVFDVGDKLL